MNDPDAPPGDNPTGQRDDVSAARVAKAYRSHDPSQVSPPHKISFEDEPVKKHPPKPSYQTEHQPEPESRQLVDLGIHNPFWNAFFVSLGWAAGQVLIRLLSLLFMFAVIGIVFWYFVKRL